jgi:formylmethanofuran dehydrogenase subunit E
MQDDTEITNPFSRARPARTARALISNSEPTLESILQETAAMHRHLCPRQVLGARIGLLAGARLGLALPQQDKRMLALVETDGCFADGISVATGCWVGRRTMRLMDHGKIAATFVDVQAGSSLRIAPVPNARKLARAHAQPGQGKWQAYLEGYQTIPDDALFTVQPVSLTFSLEELLSSPRARAVCEACGEEIVNGREVHVQDRVLCRACAGESYWVATPSA